MKLKLNGVTKIRGPRFTDVSQFACQSNEFISEFSDLLLTCAKMFLIYCR